jgi:hypothetical protein
MEGKILAVFLARFGMTAKKLPAGRRVAPDYFTYFIFFICVQ